MTIATQRGNFAALGLIVVSLMLMACSSNSRGTNIGLSRRQGGRMLGLVDAELAGTGNRGPSDQTPSFIDYRPAELNSLRFQLVYSRLNVIASKVQLMMNILVGRVYTEFGRRQGKDQPSVAGVDRGQFEDIFEKASKGLGLRAEDYRVDSCYHDVTPFFARPDIGREREQAMFDTVIAQGAAADRWSLNGDRLSGRRIYANSSRRL